MISTFGGLETNINNSRNNPFRNNISNSTNNVNNNINYRNPFQNNINNSTSDISSPEPYKQNLIPSETTIQVQSQLEQMPENYVGLRQNQEQINLLRMIANSLNHNNGTGIYFSLIMIIVVTIFYIYLSYDFSAANGFSLRATTDLFLMSLGLFIIFFVLTIFNIYNSINKININN